MKTNESRRKLIIITIIFILFQLPVSFAQNYNYENDVIINTSGTPSCNCNSSSQRLDPANNIPFSNSVVKIVMVDFNVFQDGSGGGNFQNTTNINSGTPRLYSILSYLNNYYSHNGTNLFLQQILLLLICQMNLFNLSWEIFIFITMQII